MRPPNYYIRVAALALFALASAPLTAQPGTGPISGGGGGGGLPGPGEVTEAMLKVVNACTDEYVLTCETTTGDFEWQAAATGDVVGPASATDNAIVRYDLTTGKLVQNSAVTVADTTGDLQWEGTTADDFEGNFTFADPTADWTWNWSPTGQSLAPVGTASLPAYSFAGDPNTGIFGDGSDSIRLATNGSSRLVIDNGVITSSLPLAGNANPLYGWLRAVSASTAGSGAPNTPAFQTNTFVYTNEGSTAENYHTLPSAITGYTYTFFVQDADGIRITAAAGDTIRPIAGTAASAAAGFIRCATQGAFITLVAINATEWVAIGSAGTWTIDA